MYTYLQNAIAMFTNPASIGMRLASYKAPVGTMEIFEGNGKDKVFVLDDNFELIKGAFYCFIENYSIEKSFIEVKSFGQSIRGRLEQNGKVIEMKGPDLRLFKPE